MREAIVKYADGREETVRVQGAAEVPTIKMTPDVVSVMCIGRRGDFLLFLERK